MATGSYELLQAIRLAAGERFPSYSRDQPRVVRLGLLEVCRRGLAGTANQSDRSTGRPRTRRAMVSDCVISKLAAGAGHLTRILVNAATVSRCLIICDQYLVESQIGHAPSPATIL